ncbi:MAG: hypothetical protein L0229_31680, partial [Blastocatellia bacterium]|nr:hypothetical protein [Blastocatellia bacterium]
RLSILFGEVFEGLIVRFGVHSNPPEERLAMCLPFNCEPTLWNHTDVQLLAGGTPEKEIFARKK